MNFSNHPMKRWYSHGRHMRPVGEMVVRRRWRKLVRWQLTSERSTYAEKHRQTMNILAAVSAAKDPLLNRPYTSVSDTLRAAKAIVENVAAVIEENPRGQDARTMEHAAYMVGPLQRLIAKLSAKEE